MSGYNMNNIDPFGFGQRQSAPTEGSEQQPNSFGEQMSQPMAGGQGIMGGESIRQYLMPFLDQINSQIQQQAQQEMKQKIPAYIQQVQQVTDQTFGLGVQFQGGLDPMSQNQVSKPMQSSPNQNLSPFGTASFFR